MSNELMDRPIEFEVNGEPVKLSGKMVRDYLVSGDAVVTDQEIVMFMQLCKYQKLNPFLREAYLVKFGDKPAQIITSKEAFMKRAESHPQYNGMKAGIIIERNGEMIDIEGAVKLKDDKLVGGWAEVYRKDRELPVVVKISHSEFSKGQATWNQMPLNMIRKTAIVNAMREAFPDNLGSMYTEEESSDQQLDIEHVVADEIKQNANTEELPVIEESKQEERNIEKEIEELDVEELHEEVPPFLS